MKPNFSYVLLVAIASLITSCIKDDKKDEPAPTYGAVTGSISPASGASKVFLITGTDTIKTTPAADGTFQLNDLNPGAYQIAVKANPGYVSPAPTTISVSAGTTTNVPVIVLDQITASGLFTLTIDGVNYSGIPSYQPIRIGGSNNIMIIMVINNKTIMVDLPTITGPANFSTTNRNIDFSVSDSSIPETWRASWPGGSGTLTVTSYDIYTRKGYATFSFTGISPGLTEKKVTGSFYNVQMMQ